MTGREEWLTSSACVLQLLLRWHGVSKGREWGSVRANKERWLVTALPWWHRAAGGRQQEAISAMQFWVYFRSCSDPQDALILEALLMKTCHLCSYL